MKLQHNIHRAALVAGGNRSAAFLMEWLGLPTLESSNDPAKPQEENAFRITRKGPKTTVKEEEKHRENGGQTGEGVSSPEEAVLSNAGTVPVSAPEGAAAEAALVAADAAAAILEKASNGKLWRGWVL